MFIFKWLKSWFGAKPTVMDSSAQSDIHNAIVALTQRNTDQIKRFTKFRLRTRWLLQGIELSTRRLALRTAQFDSRYMGTLLTGAILSSAIHFMLSMASPFTPLMLIRYALNTFIVSFLYKAYQKAKDYVLQPKAELIEAHKQYIAAIEAARSVLTLQEIAKSCEVADKAIEAALPAAPGYWHQWTTTAEQYLDTAATTIKPLCRSVEPIVDGAVERAHALYKKYA